ncbi:MAG: serine/threonine protein kinase, partial [Planctomycetes bacterium]|nr:serine/threonine protein kinase [Planctomycetota bacterium]
MPDDQPFPTADQSRCTLPQGAPDRSPESTHADVPAWVDIEDGEPGADCGARYANRGEIARGGMGVVYLAHDTRLNRDVVVKTLRRESRSSPTHAARFRKEAQVTAQLQHPGIPPVHDSGRLADGSPFLVMKWVRGQTLAQLLRARSEPAGERGNLLRVFVQVAQTIAYAHSRGIIHRDLKPANIMVGAFGEVQVMDWGLAKLLTESEMRTDPVGERDTDPELTRAGMVVGTPAYMPPEQARGELGQVGPPA